MKKDEESWRWVIVVAAFFIGFLTDGLQYSYGLLFIEFLDEFKESKTTTSWIGGLFFGWFTFGPVASMMTNRYGCRIVVVTGGAMCFIGLFASVFSTSIPFLFVSFGCFGGFGFLLLNIPREIAIIQYFEKKRSFAMGIATCGSGVGTIVFNPMVKWLIDVYGWRGTLLVESALILNCVACGLAMRPFVETSHEKNKDTSKIMRSQERVSLVLFESTDTETDHAATKESNIHEELLEQRIECVDENGVGTNSSRSGDVNECVNDKNETIKMKLINIGLLKEPKVILFLFVCFFEGISYYTPFTFLPDLVVGMGRSRAEAAWLLTTIGIVNTVFRIPIGFLGDLKCLSRIFTVSANYLFLGIVTWAMPYLQQYSVMVTVCVLFGLFIATYVVFTPVVVADLFEEDDVVDIYGYAFFIFGVGALISGPLAGAQFDATGDYNLSFLTAGGSFVLTGILSFILYILHRKDKRIKKSALD